MPNQLIAYGVPAQTCEALAALKYEISPIAHILEIARFQAAQVSGSQLSFLVDLDKAGNYTEAPAKVRESGFIGPVIGLTNIDRRSRDKEPEMIEALFLRQGGDRLVRGPYSPELVHAVIQSIARTRKPGTMPDEIRDFARGRIRINLARHQVFVDDVQVSLTVTEMKLLQYLGERPGHVRSREQILGRIMPHKYPDQRMVDSHIKRLRRKIADAARDPATAGEPLEPIIGIYGVGYKIEP